MKRLLIIVATLCAFISGASVTESLADDQSQAVAAGYRVGMITSIQGNTLFIDGTGYQLSPDVKIVDPEDRELGPADIRSNSEVRFQIKREQPNRIVKMILIVPQ